MELLREEEDVDAVTSILRRRCDLSNWMQVVR